METRKKITNPSDLINAVITDRITKITRDRFECILHYADSISKLDGDIVECGVWAGGMCIFLAKVFDTKKIWVVDSFEGCQDPREGKYFYPRESHYKGMYTVSLEQVKRNFEEYDALDESRVFFLKGWVKDTLAPNVCTIDKISLLRVDVDSYSATLEVLDYLYDKVQPGGMIVFDDISGNESLSAIREFINRGNELVIKDPVTHNVLDVFANNIKFRPGCYCIK